MKEEMLLEGFERCPGCDEGDFISAVAEVLKEEGKVSPDMRVPGLLFRVPLYNQQDIATAAATSLTGKIELPVMEVLIQVCDKCKKIYLRHIKLIHQEMAVSIEQIGGPMNRPQQQRRPPAPPWQMPPGGFPAG